MEEIEARHFRNCLQEEGTVRDLIVEANRVLGRLRDNYGLELSRRSALELHDDKISHQLQDLLDDLSFEDEAIANYWVSIDDHDLTGDYIPKTMEGGFYGLDQIGQIGDDYWPEDVDYE